MNYIFIYFDFPPHRISCSDHRAGCRSGPSPGRRSPAAAPPAHPGDHPQVPPPVVATPGAEEGEVEVPQVVEDRPRRRSAAAPRAPRCAASAAGRTPATGSGGGPPPPRPSSSTAAGRRCSAGPRGRGSSPPVPGCGRRPWTASGGRAPRRGAVLQGGGQAAQRRARMGPQSTQRLQHHGGVRRID